MDKFPKKINFTVQILNILIPSSENKLKLNKLSIDDTSKES